MAFTAGLQHCYTTTSPCDCMITGKIIQNHKVVIFVSSYPQQKILIYFRLQVLCGFSINIYATEIPFCSKLKPLKGQPCWFTKGEQKKFGSWSTVYICHTCLSALLTVTSGQGLPDTTWQCSQLWFHTFEVLIFNKLNHKPNKTLLFVYF